MRHQLLIPVAPSGASARSKLSAFKKRYGIRTHRSDMRRKEHPWIALLPFEADRDKHIATIMAESCRLYDECGYCVTGEGELSAVRELCRKNEIHCPL